MDITLQKPLVVAELGFLLSVTYFFVPSFSFVKSSPVEYVSYDILLSAKTPYLATGDIYLSPTVRLLADGDCGEQPVNFEFDGRGYNLVLPPPSALGELLPLILIGTHGTLRLRNVTIVNAESLPDVLQLATGSQLLTQEEDGVRMERGMPAELGPGFSSSGENPSSLEEGKLSIPEMSQRHISEPSTLPSSDNNYVDHRSIEIRFVAIGIGIQLTQLEQENDNASGSRPRSREHSYGSMVRNTSATSTIASLDGDSSLKDGRSRSAGSLREGSTAYSPSPLPLPSPSPSAYGVNVLAIMADVQATYNSVGSLQSGSLILQGLRAETRRIADIRKELASRADPETSLSRHRKLQGTMQSVILYPCKVSLDFKLESQSRTDLTLAITDVKISLSLPVLNLVTSLSTSLLEPVMQPQPDAPLRAVSQFDRIWSFTPRRYDDQELAVSLATTGAAGGLTVWHPHSPSAGYGITGHIITPGDGKPAFEVIMVAINSGLAAYPVEFEKIWTQSTVGVDSQSQSHLLETVGSYPPSRLTIWRPVPPESYVAMGDVVTIDGSRPAITDVLCIHTSATVQVPWGECLYVDTIAGTFEGSFNSNESSDLELWCVDNSMGTFFCAPPGAPPPGQYPLDLRSPLGVPPATLYASFPSQSTQNDSLKLFQHFIDSRRQRRKEMVRRTLTPTIVDFERVLKTPEAGFWRPVAPPGHLTFGDCAISGASPPRSVLVVNMDHDSNSGNPVVLPSLGYEMLPRPVLASSNDEPVSGGGTVPSQCLCFWKPIAPEGYVAVGYVLTVFNAAANESPTGPTSPVACVRSDAVEIVRPLPSTKKPTCSLFPSLPVPIRTADDSIHTFVVGSSQNCYKLVIDKLDTIASGQDGNAKEDETSNQGNVDIVVAANRISILLLDDLNTPLLEAEAAGVDTGVHGPERSVVQAYLGLRLEVAAYDARLRCWEPVLEATDIISKCDINLGAKPAHGLDPGIRISIKSSAEMVYSSIAVGHVISLLSALGSWHAQQNSINSSSSSTSWTDSSLTTTVVNALGIDAAIEIDHGNRMEMVNLPAGRNVVVVRPLPSHPARRKLETYLSSRDNLPHDTVLFDVDRCVVEPNDPVNRDDLDLVNQLQKSGARLYCAIQFAEDGVDNQPPLQGGRPPRSRAVGCIAEERQTEHDNLYKEGSRSQLEFVWKERLVLALPTRPKAITSATVEIWNAEGDGGRGQLLAKANYQIVVDDIDVSGKTQAQTNKKPERKSVPFCITAVGTNGGSFQVHGTHEFRAGWRARSDLWLNNDLDLLGSGVGQRAVSLASDPGTWVVVPEVRRTGASNTDENLIALHVGTTNVVLESKYRGEKKGGWYEEFRSPCRLVNSTEYVLWVRISDRTLGKCAPGRAIPLPLSSLHDPSACKLAIRPLGGQIVMEDDYCYCTEDGVKDNDTLECDDKEGEKDDGMAWSNDCILNLKLRPGTVDAPRVMRSDPGWFAQVTTSAEIVGPGQIIDVKITITPALMLINRLPMPCGVILWQQNETVLDKEPREEEDSWQMLEEAQGHRLIDDSEIQKELMARATERLFPGEELPVYSVDVARPVHLTLYPDGYDWAQGGPAPLSPGPRDGAPQRAGGLETFMERVLVTRPGAKTGVYIHLERQQHTSGLGSTIMFYAPLWIVNTSNLAIEAAVVDVASADASPLASGADAAGKDVASSVGPTGIRVIRTSDVVRASDSSRGRSVAPHSVELFGPDIVSNKVRQYGVKIKVAGSGWTAPLGWGRGQEDQKDAEKEGSNSFLLRADASDYGVTYEVVGRLETGPFVASRVLRIEPRLVMSNHSRVNIELALCLGNAYQTLTVPPGARGVSCHFPRGNSNAALRVLRFRRSLQSHTGSDLVANQSPWSRPLEVEAGVEEQHHILLSSPYETLDSQPSVLRVSIQARGVGTIHVILESVGPLWPVLVENRTSIQLEYKVPIGRRLTQSRSLSPWSCVGYAEERIKLLSSDQQGQQGDADSEETSKSYELGNQAHLEVKDTLTTAQGPCDVVLGYVHNLVTTPAGVGNVPGEGGGLGIGGAVLGRGGADVALRVLETSQPYSSSPRVLSLSNLHDWKGKEEVSIVVEVPGLEVSLLDDGPAGKREIVCLTVVDLNTSMAWGSIPQGRFRLARMSVRRLQLDDQMAGTRYPVVVSAAKDSKGTAAMLTAAGVLQVTTGSRGRTFFPFIGAQCPEGVQLAISERLVWKLADMVGRLGDVIASINRIDNKEQEQEEADFPIQIRHLSMGDIVLDVSFQGDPSARRPSQLAGGLVGRVIDLASFQAARVIIHGLDRSGIKTVRTALMEELASWFRGELIGAAWSLVRNFGVIGGASRFFGLLSAGVARLSEPGVRQASLSYKERDSQEVGRREGKDDRAASEKRAIAPSTSQLPSSKATASESRAALAARPSQRKIADVGDGLLEGAGAFGSSLMRGVRGLVEKPLQGARATGIGGAVRGAAAGLVGVVSNPVSGALDALSATAEGFDAKFASKAREERLVYARRRLPRVVSGDGRILPIVREGSDREAVVEQLGQALLWATLETKEGEADQSQVEGEGSFEAYEEHFVLPDDVVAVLTTRNLLAIKAPGFARLEGAAEIGMLTVADVGAGTIVWRVTWDDVLAMELRWGGEERYPDRIVIHRKGARRTSSTTSSRANLAQGTSSRSLPLAVMLQCFPGTPQASQLKIVAEKVLRKYYRDPVRHDVLWSERHAARAALPSDQPPDHLPTSLPSLDFELEWHTNPARSPVIHFWRPVAPPGYKPVGDVATLDGEAPVHPVPCFRDDTVLRAARLSGDEGMAVLDETHSRSLPTIAPVEFTLIWRFNGARPVSFWMPVAPEGYVALGAVVVGQSERPNVDEYVCVREDLTVPSRVYDSPIWAFDPVPGILAAKTGGLRNEQSSNERKALAEALARSQNPEAWKVAVWPVDNRLGTFLVVRALSKPPAEIARGVEEVEQRGSKLDKYVV